MSQSSDRPAWASLEAAQIARDHRSCRCDAQPCGHVIGAAEAIGAALVRTRDDAIKAAVRAVEKTSAVPSAPYEALAKVRKAILALSEVWPKPGRHEPDCVSRVSSSCVYLRDGTKVVLEREGKGVRLAVVPQDRITVAGGAE